ncbi:MAG: hypothetical protein OXJ54_14585 [Gemmatimonadetes bacterium]|nr:hypothetical protein [Candidatus Palauibacter rhopaloidicola]
MPLDLTILREIESAEFALKLGLSGSRARAMQALVDLPEAKALLDSLRENASAVHGIASRVEDLLQAEIDPRYTHPDDAAIAVYLRALDLFAPRLAVDLAPMVADRRQNLWWSVPVLDSLQPTLDIEMDWPRQGPLESVRYDCSTPISYELAAMLPSRPAANPVAVTFGSDASPHFVADARSRLGSPRALVYSDVHDVHDVEEAIAL